MFFRLAIIFVLKFLFPTNFFVSQFCLFLSVFKWQVLLNVLQILKCDMLIQTLIPTSETAVFHLIGECFQKQGP